MANRPHGRAIAQEVVSFPPWRPRSGHVGFVVDKAALGQVFSEYFGFSCQASDRLLHTHHYPVAGTIGQYGVSSTISPPPFKKESSSCQRGHPISTNPKLSDGNKNLAISLRWVLDIKTARHKMTSDFGKEQEFIQLRGMVKV
jgi:hypothetical protein